MSHLAAGRKSSAMENDVVEDESKRRLVLPTGCEHALDPGLTELSNGANVAKPLEICSSRCTVPVGMTLFLDDIIFDDI